MESKIEKQIIQLGEKQQLIQLEELLKDTSTKEIIAILTKKIGRNDAACLWNYLLRGLANDNELIKEKRYECVKAFLKQLSSIELSYKQTYDLLTRLFLDLPSFTNDQLIEMIEFTIDWLKMGDPKCVGWKDLLPEIIDILCTQQSFDVNSIKTTGIEYRTTIIRNLCTTKWPLTIYTPIANMFRDMKLNNEEITSILKKFCCNLYKLNPTEIPSLSFQLFSLCTSASQILLIIMSLEKYFHKNYYKKLFANMESDSTDFDSIDTHSDKELREAEETVLHHLSYCTQFKFTEQQFNAVLKNLSSCPSVILTPFIISSILSMTKINRDPDTPLTQSILLPLLRNIIKINEDEKEMYKKSAWFRHTSQTKEVDLEQIFTILIDQNKDGKDVITPGLVNLSFVLLKCKNSSKLNSIAIAFLQKFIKKRFIFGSGVIKNLAEWMIVEQDSIQYSDCLTVLSLTDTYTLSECVKTIKYVLDFFLWIPGNNAMRMMSFILPIVKISHTIRDAFIDILRKAIYSRDLQTCCVGIHGFCLLLKQLRNNNSQRSTSIGNCGILTQQSISGYSLMSQLTFGNKNNPHRHFDMLALEIIGILRVVFTKPLAMKQILYEDLSKAVEFNLKLAPHVLQFIERHFRSYFHINGSNNLDDIEKNDERNDIDNDDDEKMEIIFHKIIRTREDDENYTEIEVLDDLGHLTMFVADCIVICNKHEQLNCDPFILKNLFRKLIKDMTTKKKVESFEFTEPLSHEKHQIASQILGFIEGLMYYALWTSQSSNSNCENLLTLFKLHRAIRDKIKSLSGSTNKKQMKKTKHVNDTTTADLTQNNITVNGNVTKKSIFKFNNIWDLPTLERFQRLLHDEAVSFASKESSSKLRSNRDLVCYVVEVISQNIENLRQQPDYKQICHSKRVMKNLIDLTKLIYEKCVKRLSELWSNFHVRAAYLCVECLRQSLITADTIFKKKFTEWINQVDFEVTRTDSKSMTTILQETVEAALRDEDELIDDVDGKKIPSVILQCLEILYDNLTYDEQQTLDAYCWLLKFCQNYELQSKDLGLAHKLLFNQWHKTNPEISYYPIAMHLEKIFGEIDENVEIQPHLEFKSITEGTVETCTMYLLNIIQQQIEEVEFFVNKCKSIHMKIKITSENDQNTYIEILKTMECSISTKLIHNCETLLHLTNACLPLGTTMDNLMRVLMQYYICLTNFTKHFIIRYPTIPVSFREIKFDQLIKVSGKPLAKRIYSLITYIEANIFDTNSKRKKQQQTKESNPQADKAKVLRDTKFIPKLILRIENFNKFVMLLCNKTKNFTFNHYLHMGTVRDFRIKTSELKDAIDKTLTHSSQIEYDESMIDEVDRLSNDENDNEENESGSINTETNDENRQNSTNSNNEIINEVELPKNLDELENEQKKNQEVENVSKKKTIKNTQKRKKNESKSKKNEESSKLLTVLSIDEINLSEPSVQGSSNSDDIIHDEPANSESQILRNLEKVNRKVRKRKSAEKKKEDDIQPKSKRTRRLKN